MTVAAPRPAAPDDGDPPVGALLRQWRRRRRLSQLELAVQAETSTRHLSYVETGRSAPSRALILHLADHLGVPARERNQLLLAGGFAPVYSHHGLDAPTLTAARTAISHLLRAQEPFPALVVDRHWNLLDANDGVEIITDGCAAHLLEPPINVLRLSLHPDGMAPRITNLTAWRARILNGLRHQAVTTGDPVLTGLLDELTGYPFAGSRDSPGPADPIAVPLRCRYRDSELHLITTTSVFGAPLDVTISEIAVESFFPADRHTREVLENRSHARA